MDRAGAYDVAIVGAGNSALTAALAAREQGAQVLVLEKAPIHRRGGNTYFTGGVFRFAFQDLDAIRALLPDLPVAELANVEVDGYAEAEYYSDIMRVTEGLADPTLTQVLVDGSNSTMRWLRSKGMRFEPVYGPALDEGRRRFSGGVVLQARGGGRGLSEQLFDASARAGVEVRYEHQATRLIVGGDGGVSGVRARGPSGFETVTARAVVLACGGFEANPEMRARYLGPDWDLVKVRGSRFNTGDGIRMALEIGAQPAGHWSSCHAVTCDVNAPDFGDWEVVGLHQKHSYQLGIVVNVRGERFLDEGADFASYTWARYGRELLLQPQRVAFQLFDAKVADLLSDEYRIPQATRVEASTIEGLATALDLDGEALAKTVVEFNAAVRAGDFNPNVLDGKGTSGLQIPKSNWALPLDTPPYTAYPVTCGIAYAFGGLKIDAKSSVLDNRDHQIPGLYAAGGMVGGLFYYNYPGGSGLCAGSVFGRIAGSSAAEEAAGRSA